MAYRAVLLVALLVAGGTSSLAASTSPVIYSPNKVQWTAGTGPMAGTRVALLYGDPAKPGPFVMRIRMPDGTKFAPHYHPVVENVTVLQGTLLIGVGDKMNMAKIVTLPAGSFLSVPPNVHHYAVAKGDTIVQINDSGPWAMMAVKMK